MGDTEKRKRVVFCDKIKYKKKEGRMESKELAPRDGV